MEDGRHFEKLKLLYLHNLLSYRGEILQVDAQHKSVL